VEPCCVHRAPINFALPSILIYQNAVPKRYIFALSGFSVLISPSRNQARDGLLCPALTHLTLHTLQSAHTTSDETIERVVGTMSLLVKYARRRCAIRGWTATQLVSALHPAAQKTLRRAPAEIKTVQPHILGLGSLPIISHLHVAGYAP
jgi:hypothetical protein